MLVLSRFVDEEIVIGNPANPIGRIYVDSIIEEKVSLRFDFPERIPVNRKEIADKILKEREEQQASGMKDGPRYLMAIPTLERCYT